MVNRKHILNAPLISSECSIGWGVPTHEMLIKPAKFKKEFKKINEGEITEFDSEWLVPKDYYENVLENEPIYRIEYIKQGISLAISLSRKGIKVSSDSSYQTWDEFNEEIQRTYKIVSGSLTSSNTVVTSLQLRYIDAFKKNLLKGKTPVDFILKDLGVNVSLPIRVNHILRRKNAPEFFLQGKNAPKFFLNYLIPISDNIQFKVSLGEANVDSDETAAICDISAENFDDSGLEDISTSMGELHALTDEFFFSLIKPISNRLE
jgi:uncharacterized protein (TIGR04255 family)